MTMSMTRHKTTRLGSVLLATFGFSALALSGAAGADQIHFERGVGSNQEWKQMYRVAEPNMHDVLRGTVGIGIGSSPSLPTPGERS